MLYALYIALFSLALFALFYLVYRRNRARMINGVLFGLFVISAAIALFICIVQMDIPVLNYVLFLLVAIFIAISLFGVYLLIAILVFNGRIVYKRERHSLANSLGLLLAGALIVFLILAAFMGREGLPLWVQTLWFCIGAVLGLLLLYILTFLSSLILCNLARPRPPQHFIIVLGSGLIDGKVTALLGRRIDRAIAYYEQQAKTQSSPKLVLSGGQGSDEPVSEAAAMRDYAVEKGIPVEDMLLEDRSTSTRENFLFSKALIEQNSEGNVKVLYATSNYHLLHAGIIARKAGLRAVGIGAKTAWYYLPNALLRECVAMLALHKVGLIILASILFVCALLLNVLPYILSYLL